MPEVLPSIFERLKKNDASFYCLFAVLILSAAGGFVFSATVQSAIFVILLFFFCFIFIKKSFSDNGIYLALLPLLAVFFSYLGADFQVNARNASFGLINAFLVFFIMLHGGKKSKENTLMTLLFLGLWVSFFIFMQRFSGNPDIERSMSLNINIIAGFLLIVYPLAFGFVEKNKNPEAFLLLAFIIFAAVIFTKSRTAIVLIYAINIFYFIKLKDRRYVGIFFTVVSVIVFAGLIYAFFLKSEWKSFSERLIWWNAAWLMFKDYPVFGVGFGNYGALFSYYRPEPVLNTLFAHNVFLQLLAETGIFGIICFFTSFYVILKKILSSFKSKNADAAYMRSAAVSVIFFIAFNIVDYGFYLPACMIAFFVLCAFLCGSGESFQRKNHFALIIIVPALIAAYIAVRPAVAERYYEKGKMYASKKDYNEAKKRYLKALKYDGKNPEYFHQAADSSFKLYALGSRTEISYLDEAVEFELMAEKLFVHSAQIKAGLANLYNLKGDNENAAKYAAAAREADKFNHHYGIAKDTMP
ncbi:MAG: O-antigen ligase family protein [Endomicrobia bacterium]|nr:O-antigen ligase family protein [Endomicrobiia bacterium]